MILVNSEDKTVRALSVVPISEAGAYEDFKASPGQIYHFPYMWKAMDVVGSTRWSGVGFTGDGEYCYGGASNPAKHNIYIWTRTTGVLNKILEGPREPLYDVDVSAIFAGQGCFAG